MKQKLNKIGRSHIGLLSYFSGRTITLIALTPALFANYNQDKCREYCLEILGLEEFGLGGRPKSMKMYRGGPAKIRTKEKMKKK